MSRLIKMREIRTEMPVRHCSGNGVAIDAGCGFENPAAFGDRIIVGIGRRCLLFLHPSVKLFRRIYVNAQKHLGVLRPAVLRALPEIKSSLLGIDPHVIHAVRNQVRLPRETWHPEAVIGVRG